MNSYLKIAEKILNRSKKPLTAKEILEAAYRIQLVPPHLFGKTQHKTLQARLSEDVLYNKMKTLFVRTGPGRFTLRANTEERHKVESKYIAPLRSYQLKKFEVMCARRRDLENRLNGMLSDRLFAEVSDLFTCKVPLLLAERDYEYVHLRMLVIIRHSDLTLTLTGDSDSLLSQHRALGLFGFIKETDSDLFSSDPLGFDNAARRIVCEQTNIPRQIVDDLIQINSFSSMIFAYMASLETEPKKAIVLTAYECHDPDVVIANIASNRSPRWTRALSGINNIDALEPISRQILENIGMAKSIIT